MPNKKHDLLLVFLGGSFGTLLRFLMGLFIPYVGNFPLPTFLVNIVGSFIIGIVFSIFKSRKQKLFFGTGILGGFTTYSAFALETATYSAINSWMPFVYAVATIVLGLAAALFGVWATKRSGFPK